jgi:hypothetical protein
MPRNLKSSFTHVILNAALSAHETPLWVNRERSLHSAPQRL